MLLVVTAALLAFASTAGAQPVLTDALYRAHHPRLLFTGDEIPALRAKVTDGGHDDDAYRFIRGLVRDDWANRPIVDVLGAWYADGAIMEIGLVSRIESPEDQNAMALGKAVTLYIANTWEPDFDEAHSGMRLRTLALGYDMFFADASEAERTLVRDEMVRYVQKMIWNPAYKVFEMQPYLANHSAMFAAALGLAAICLQGEAEAYISTDALAMADRIVERLLQWQFDGGSYREGDLYALWTLKNVIVYFEARKRFDGFDYSRDSRLRAVEQWLAYELLPEGHARSNNVNDSMISETPYARSSAYFDWAMHNWNSGLSSWLWEHAVGAYGLDLGEYSDKAATVLWNRPVAPVPPGDVLPLHRVWPGRGMYQVRSGWQSGASSDDVVFSLYSGKYEGGHAQEDQNQFTLYGYGERFAIDHGAGSIAKESEAHNLVLIDGEGQHNAGQSIGTDGALSAYLLGDMADWVEGDASRAYTTFSEYNLPDHPVDGADWSWGYRGANPVLSAKRRVLAVHGGGVPYVYIMDDIQKDNLAHHYRWRMHTLASNTVDTATQPFCIHGATGALDVHLLRPGDAAVSVGTFDNRTGEPDAKVLEVACDAVAPAFALLMLPRPVDVPALPVARADYPWGFACSVAWPDGRSDCMVRNDTGDRVTHGDIETDALVTLVRRDSGGVTGFLVADASFMAIDGVPQVIVTDGRMGCELSGSTLHIDRYDVQFQVRDRGVTQLLYRAQEFGFVAVDGYVMRAGATAVGDTPAPMAGLDVTAYPNPFNPVVTVRVDGAASPHTRVVVYDIRGRRVRTLWNAPLRDTSRSLRWDGRNDAGAPVASGVYLVEVSTPSASRTIKLSLLK